MIGRNLELPQLSRNIPTSELIAIYNQIEEGNFQRINCRISQSYGGSGGVPKWRFIEETIENQRHILMVCLFGCHFDLAAPFLTEDRHISPEIKNMLNYLAMDVQSRPKNISIEGSGVELNVHTGYYLAAVNVVNTLERELAQNNMNLCRYNEVIFFGHSLGGAVAEIAAIYLRENFQYRHIKGFGFGIPRCVSQSFCKLTSRYCLTLTNPDDPFTTYKTAAKLIAKANGLLILQRTRIELFEEIVRELDNVPLSEYYFPEMNVNILDYGVVADNTTYIKSALRWKKQARNPPEYTLEELLNRKNIHSAAYYQRMVERAQNDLQEEYHGNLILRNGIEEQNFIRVYRRKMNSFSNKRSNFEDDVRNNINIHTGDIHLTAITPEIDENERQEIANLVERERERIIQAYLEYLGNPNEEIEIREIENIIREDQNGIEGGRYQVQVEIVEERNRRRKLNITIAVVCGVLSVVAFAVGGLGIAAAAGVSTAVAVSNGAAVGAAGIAAGGIMLAGTVVHSIRAERLTNGYIELERRE